MPAVLTVVSRVTGLSPHFWATMRPALSRMISLAVMAWPFGTAGVAVNFKTALTGPWARVAVWAPDFAVALSLPSYDAAKAGATSWPEATVPVTVRTIAVARGARRRLRVRRLCLGAVVVVSMGLLLLLGRTPPRCGDGRCSGRRGCAPEF